MSKIFIPLDAEQKKPLPDAYIQSSIIYKKNHRTYIKIYFHIAFHQDNWLDNNKILSDIRLNIELNKQSFFNKSLLALKDFYNIQKNIIDGFVDLDCGNLSVEDLKVSVFCRTDTIIGNIDEESVLQSNRVESTSFGNNTFTYINKHKDARILELDGQGKKVWIDGFQPAEERESANYGLLATLNNLTNTINNNKNEYISNIYISNTISKKANLCFMFDLQKFLLNNSKVYKALSRNKNIKNKILSSLELKPENITFYKKNITLKDQDSQKISSTIKINKLSRNTSDHKYFISVTDDNNNVYNRNKYSINVDIDIIDASHSYLNKNIIENLSNINKVFDSYSTYLQDLSKSSLFSEKNYREYYFLNEYNTFYTQNDIEKHIHDLSDIYSLVTGFSKEEYVRLLTSALNPLTCNFELFDILITKINDLISLFTKLLEAVPGAYSESVKQKSSNDLLKLQHNFFKEYNYENKSINYIDYDYDYKCGYEVISADNFTVRSNETYNGFKTISKAEYNTRNIFEINKFYATSDLNSNTRMSYLTISSIDLDKQNYYLLNNTEVDMVTFYKDIFVQLCQYNNHNFDYDTVNSCYYQLLDDGICIKSLSDRSNGSINNLIKSTVFDPNMDTSQESLEYLTSTGLLYLYHSLPEYSYNRQTSSAVMKKIQADLGTNAVLKYAKESPLYYDTDATPDTNAALLMLYNNVFIQEPEIIGDSYTLYWSKPVSVNKIFTDKLIQYNEYYLVRDERQIGILSPLEETLDFSKELKSYNIPSIYLGRNVIQEYQLLNSVEDI